MTDLADQNLDGNAPADAPATEGSDIEKKIQEAIAAAVAKVTADNEERIRGFQRLVSERETEIRRLNEQAELAALDEEQREVEVARRRDAEFERLQAENELLKLAPEYANELPIFQRLLAAPSAKDQLNLLREVLMPKAPANEPKKDMEPASVDPNNPASGIPGGGVFIEGMPMTDELAERLLQSSSRMRP